MVLFPRRIPRVVVSIIVATLVVSIIAAVDARHGGGLYAHLALIPADVWRGQLWRLATWPLVEVAPLALIFACVSMYWFGGDLAQSWGERRFARFVGAIVLVAGAVTALVGMALPEARHHAYLSGWALGDALVIAWALRFPERRIRVYGLLWLGGPALAYGTFGLTVLFAVYYGAWPFLPELAAGAAALLHMTGALGRWTERVDRLRRRRHLRVVRGGRDDPGWMN